MRATHKRVAILIGIDKYTGGIPPLRNAVRDITELGKVLKSRFGFDPLLIQDEEATKAKLTAEAIKLSSTLTEEDCVLFYFAGHGLARSMLVAMGKDRPSESKPLDGDFNLVTYDAEIEKQSTWWSSRELLSAVRSWPCRQSLLILDCCYAGQAALDAHRSLHMQLGEPLSQETFAWHEQGKASQLLASAAHNEQAADSGVMWLKQEGERTESGGNHSPFAQALIAGLEGAAGSLPGEKDDDGIILATDLYRYIYRRLKRETSKQSLFTQTPDLVKLDPKEKNREFYFLDLTRGAPNLQSIKELSKDNPYRGLHSYGIDDERRFFGRDNAIEKLITDRFSSAIPQEFRDIKSNITIITGPSGTGKSSLLLAGLVPRLLDRQELVFEFSRAAKGPVRTKLVELRKASSAASSSSASSATPAASATSFPSVPSAHAQPSAQSAPGQPKTPVEAQHSPGPAVMPWLDDKEIDKLRSANPGKVLVFVMDQMEEVLDNPPQESIAKSFWEEIENLCRKDPSCIRFVATLRSDYAAYFPTVDKACFNKIESMSRMNLAAVISGPAKRNGVVIAPDLLEKLLNTYYDTPNALPLLSFLLRRLYDKFREEILGKGAQSSEKSEISMRLYDEIKGNSDDEIFSNYADEALQEAKEKLKEKCPDEVFDRLSKGILWRFISSDKQTRRTVTEQELHYSEHTGVAQDIINHLKDKRLIVKFKDDDSGQEYYQLTHDYLVTGWPWLAALSSANTWALRHRVLRGVADASDDIENSIDTTRVQAAFAAAWKNNSQLALALEEVKRQDSICFNELERKCLEAADVAREVDKKAKEKAGLDQFRSKAFGIGLVAAVVSIVAIVGFGRWIVDDAQKKAAEANKEASDNRIMAEFNRIRAWFNGFLADVYSIMADNNRIMAERAGQQEREAEVKRKDWENKAEKAKNEYIVASEKVSVLNSEIENASNFADWYEANFTQLSQIKNGSQDPNSRYRINYLQSVSYPWPGNAQPKAEKSELIPLTTDYAKCLHSREADTAILERVKNNLNYNLINVIVETKSAAAYLFVGHKQWCMPLKFLGKVQEKPGSSCDIKQLAISDISNPRRLKDNKKFPGIVSFDGILIIGPGDKRKQTKCNFAGCQFDTLPSTWQSELKWCEKSSNDIMNKSTMIILKNQHKAYYIKPDFGKYGIYELLENGGGKSIISEPDIGMFAVNVSADRILLVGMNSLKLFVKKKDGWKSEKDDISIGKPPNQISSLSLSADGQLSLIGFKDGTAVLVDLTGRRPILGYPPLRHISGMNVSLRAVAIGPEDKSNFERKLLLLYENQVVVVRTISWKK